jgi:Na+/H+ antiporter NhaD/arsenite permease-like protein
MLNYTPIILPLYLYRHQFFEFLTKKIQNIKKKFFVKTFTLNFTLFFAISILFENY